MADDAKTLQERRRELLRRRIAESGMAAPQSDEQAPLVAGERYGLSAGQRRMWFLQAMDASDVTLNICVAYRLTGVLDEARLRAAFNDVVARHAILRTNYGVDSEGEPYQIFSDDVEITWRTGDLTHLPERGTRAADRGPARGTSSAGHSISTTSCRCGLPCSAPAQANSCCCWSCITSVGMTTRGPSSSPI